MVTLFDNDELGYLAWLEAHPEGFVANVDRARSVPNYPMAHTATHGVVSSPNSGNFTTGAYVKLCSSSLEALEAYSQLTFGRPLTRCEQCLGSRSISAFFANRLSAPLRNTRWSWGSVDGVRRRVFLRVWESEIHEHSGNRWIRVLSGKSPSRPGWKERETHLQLVESGYAAYGVLCTRLHPDEAAIASFDSTRLLTFARLRRDDEIIELEIEGEVSVEDLMLHADSASLLAEDNLEWAAESPTTRAALVDARLGQGRFRRQVLEKWDNACAVTGCTVQAALRASHCKPWRACDNKERLDSNNGLALVANLDALFDVGLITFSADGAMQVSSRISAIERSTLGVPASLRKRPSRALSRYLDHHRTHVYLDGFV